ncbi:hypothetical protein D3C80_1947290 [compost metagenome]
MSHDQDIVNIHIRLAHHSVDMYTRSDGPTKSVITAKSYMNRAVHLFILQHHTSNAGFVIRPNTEFTE